MAEKGQAHPISKKSLEAHLSKVDDSMKNINRGGGEIESLFTLVKGIGSDSKEMMAKEVQDAMQVLREGFCLYYEMHSMLELETDKINSGVSDAEKRAFLNSYSMFAAASYIDHKIDLLSGDKEPFDVDTSKIKFNFDLAKDDTLNGVLARYYGIINLNLRNDIIKEGIDLASGSHNFFKHLREQALEKKASFNPKLVDLVKDAQFRVKDDFTIAGFEASHEEKTKGAKVEFVPMEPYQVAGNVLAKQEMIRDMDRLALFDMVAKRNPILEVGGLSWSVLYDGLPGTGKSSLFRMGLTRLKKRCEQASEFWKSKNLGVLNWSQIVVDQGVKDEYYGKTGKNLLEKLEPTKRPDGIYIITTDDIDLLVSGDRGSASGGADKDILNILMQYADGINTVVRGNVQWWAATNDATSMDPALRQRFIARYSVDGPQEWYDYADIFMDKIGKWIKLGKVELADSKDYKPFEMRKGEDPHKSSEESSSGLFGALFSKKSNGISMRDIGEFCYKLKQDNPRFTGRAVNSVSEAIKKRINDYDIPEDWYSDTKVFFALEYSKRVDMLRELCNPINGQIIMEELQRYAESEKRYASDKFDSDVGKGVHNFEVNLEVGNRMKKKYGGSSQ